MHEVCSNLTTQPQERDYPNPVWYPPTLLTTTTTISTTSSYITATENHDPISPEPQLSLPIHSSLRHFYMTTMSWSSPPQRTNISTENTDSAVYLFVTMWHIRAKILSFFNICRFAKLKVDKNNDGE